ncbi:hypothetical protein Bca101_020624 [Brassica carinata]
MAPLDDLEEQRRVTQWGTLSTSDLPSRVAMRQSEKGRNSWWKMVLFPGSHGRRVVGLASKDESTGGAKLTVGTQWISTSQRRR